MSDGLFYLLIHLSLLLAGKYYYEATVTDEGLCRLGWATGRSLRELG